MSEPAAEGVREGAGTAADCNDGAEDDGTGDDGADDDGVSVPLDWTCRALERCRWNGTYATSMTSPIAERTAMVAAISFARDGGNEGGNDGGGSEGESASCAAVAAALTLVTEVPSPGAARSRFRTPSSTRPSGLRRR
jgi:hypothetical protein